MVWAAVLVAILGFVLKLITAEPAGWFLVPLAAVAGIYHIVVHTRAARAPGTPGMLAVASNLLLLFAVLLQIDFGGWNCGQTTIDGIAWMLNLRDDKGCTLIRGVPAILLDLLYYVPVAFTWRRLAKYAP